MAALATGTRPVLFRCLLPPARYYWNGSQDHKGRNDMPPAHCNRAPQPIRERPALLRVPGLSADQTRALNEAVHSFCLSAPDIAASPPPGILTAILGRLPAVGCG